jgi:hypothetical protein
MDFKSWTLPALMAGALWFGFSLHQISRLETDLLSHRAALQEMARQYVALEAACQYRSHSDRIPMENRIMKGVRCEW